MKLVMSWMYLSRLSLVHGEYATGMPSMSIIEVSTGKRRHVLHLLNASIRSARSSDTLQIAVAVLQ